MKTLSQKAKDAIVKVLIKEYDLPKKLALRYSEVLVIRAVRFLLNGNLDGYVVAEDLYQETKDWETPSYMYHDVKDQVKMKVDFPNLDYSEKEELKLLKEII
jgi:hypothetical protein